MEGLEFSVPYNNDPKTLQDVFRLKNMGKNKIREIYLAGPQKYSGAGRIMPEEIKFNEFIVYITKMKFWLCYFGGV